MRPELRGFLRYTQSLQLRRGDARGESKADSGEKASHASEKAECLVRAIDALAEEGASDSAKGLVVAGVELLEPLGDPRALLDFLLGAARGLDRLGDTTGALDLLAAAIRVGSDAPPQTFHHALLDAGRHLVRLGEIDAARDTLGSACQLAARNGLGAEHVAAKIASGWAAGSAGAIDDARRALEEALDEAKALENGERGAELHLEAGERLADLGIQDVAWDAFRTAGQLAWQSGNRALIASAQRGMHRVAKSDGANELARRTS